MYIKLMNPINKKKKLVVTFIPHRKAAGDIVIVCVRLSVRASILVTFLTME